MKSSRTVSFYYPYADRAFSLKMFQDNTSQIRGFYFTKDNISEVSKLDFSNNYAIYFLFNDSEEDKIYI